MGTLGLRRAPVPPRRRLGRARARVARTLCNARRARHRGATPSPRAMRQKTLIAATVLAGTPVLLLDEPMIGLDPRGQRELREMLSELRAGGTALMISTHQLESAEALSDRILVLNHGKLIAGGTLERTARARNRVARRHLSGYHGGRDHDASAALCRHALVREPAARHPPVTGTRVDLGRLRAGAHRDVRLAHHSRFGNSPQRQSVHHARLRADRHARVRGGSSSSACCSSTGARFSGLFANPAEARFIIASPADPFVATMYVQARQIIFGGARFAFTILYIALVNLPAELPTGKVSMDILLILTACIFIGMVPQARRLVPPRVLPLLQAAGILVIAAGTLPMVRDPRRAGRSGTKARSPAAGRASRHAHARGDRDADHRDGDLARVGGGVACSRCAEVARLVSGTL